MYRPGMILKDRKSRPKNTFVIIGVYNRTYANGSIAQRAIGLHIDNDAYEYLETNESNERIISNPTDWDSRSIDKMYPYILWEPELIKEETHK